MFKNSPLFFIALIIVSCNTTKPVVRTSKVVLQKPKKEVVNPSKKPVANKTVITRLPDSKPLNAQGSTPKTEIIESTSKTVVTNNVVKDYVVQFKDIAMNNMKTYGIPASIILAQGILESGAGRGDLAISANNHFGIKCHVGWTGESVKHDDDADQECFRKYTVPAESYKDHALFLTSRSRYGSLFLLPKQDYKAWAKGLRAAGYATDPKYPEKLIIYIERYNLQQYDAQVLGIEYVKTETNSNKNQDLQNQDPNLYEVQKGDTFYSISKKFSLSVEELKQKNSLLENALSIGQILKVK